MAKTLEVFVVLAAQLARVRRLQLKDWEQLEVLYKRCRAEADRRVGWLDKVAKA